MTGRPDWERFGLEPADDVEPCVDCGQPVEYVDDQWRHVDPSVECFLYRARA